MHVRRSDLREKVREDLLESFTDALLALPFDASPAVCSLAFRDDSPPPSFPLVSVRYAYLEIVRDRGRVEGSDGKRECVCVCVCLCVCLQSSRK